MSHTKALCATLVLLLLQGCDVAGDIVFVNDTDRQLTIEIIHKKNPNLPSDKKTEVKSRERGYIYFGFATEWSDNYILAYSQGVDTLKITSSNQEKLIYTENDILRLLTSAKRKMLKKRIVIQINESNFRVAP